MTQLSLANLIIAGVNKAATTSLYTYLSKHPEICPSSIKETNYFMPVLSGECLPPIEAYGAYFRECKARKYRMEASPRYIFGGVKLAEAILNRLGPTRIVFVFRQPIDRMVSYYKHMKNAGEMPPGISCDNYVRRALDELPAVLNRTNGKPVDVYLENIFIRGLAQGFYADYLDEWYSVFQEDVGVYFSEQLASEPAVVVREICKWLDLDPLVYQNADFTRENRSMAHKSKALLAVAEFINVKCEPFWRRHAGIKKFARNIYCLLNEKHSNDVHLSAEVRAELESVYAPYNQRLVRILSERGYRRFPEWLSLYSGTR